MSTSTRPVVVVEKRTTYIPHLLLVALLWSLAMTLDYRDQLAEANARTEDMAEQMVDCLNGRWTARTPSGAEVGCMPAVTNTPPTTKE